VQEALSNIPPTVAIQLSLNLFRLKRELLVTIQDDGRGIRPEDMEKAESLGLDGMRERVCAMKGEITVNSADGPGTRIEIAIPLDVSAGRL
jgi:signal transduction histidine kinase